MKRYGMVIKVRPDYNEAYYGKEIRTSDVFITKTVSDPHADQLRAALEDVLVPETVRSHRMRLERAGFRHTAVWLRYFNFVSIIAIR